MLNMQITKIVTLFLVLLVLPIIFYSPPARALQTALPQEIDVSDPIQTRSVLRVMLEARQFKELDQFLNNLTKRYLAGQVPERAFFETYRLFEAGIPEHGVLLDNWNQSFPDSPAALVARGTFNKALGWYHRGNRFSKKTPKSRFSNIRRYFKRAESDLIRATELQPANPMPYERLIGVYAAGGKRTKQADIFRKAIEAAGPSYNVFFKQLIFSQRKWGGSLAAVEALASAIEKHWPQLSELTPLWHFGTHIRSMRLQDNDKPLQALQLHDKAQFGSNPYFSDQRGQILYDLKQFEDVIKELDKALAVSPMRLDSLEYKASALWRLKRMGESDQVWAQALDLEPYAPGSLRLRAAQLNSQKRYDEALALLERARTYGENWVRVHGLTGEILFYRKRQYKEAGEAYARAAKLSRTNARHHGIAAWAFYLNKKDCRMVPHAKQFLKLCKVKKDKFCTKKFVSQTKWALGHYAKKKIC